MRITNETIKDILLLKQKLNSINSFNDNFTHQDAFKCLTYLYPLSSTRRKTKISRPNSWGGDRKIIIHKEIREVYNGTVQSNEICYNNWLEFYCNKENFNYIEQMSEFIPDMRKRKEFIKIHSILGDLKIRRLPGQHIIIKRDLINMISFYTYHNVNRYAPSNKYDNKGDQNGKINKITFDGNNVELSLESGENIELDISINDITMLNIVDEIKLILMEMFIEWVEKTNEVIKKDKEIIFKARQVVAKYEIVDKL